MSYVVLILLLLKAIQFEVECATSSLEGSPGEIQLRTTANPSATCLHPSWGEWWRRGFHNSLWWAWFL